MAFKLVLMFTLATVTFAAPGVYPSGYHAGPAVAVKSYAPAVVKTIAAAPVYKQVEHEAPAEYDFSYAVHDDHTGDIKSQQESRKGDAVHGYYELIEPDGHRRIVEYTADDHNGFNAVVHREDSGIKIPQPAPQVHKIIAPVHKIAYAAPVTKIAYSAPVAKIAYGTPVAKVGYSAPVAKIAYGAPLTKVSYAAPVAKIGYAAPAPVVHKVVAPGGPAHYSDGHESSHVTFHGPAAAYHY